jgi:hypothetical protein
VSIVQTEEFIEVVSQQVLPLVDELDELEVVSLTDTNVILQMVTTSQVLSVNMPTVVIQTVENFDILLQGAVGPQGPPGQQGPPGSGGSAQVYYFSGAGKTTVVDGDFAPSSPQNGWQATLYDTTSGRTRLALRSNGLWRYVEVS